MEAELKPLNVTVTRCVVNGQLYDLMNYDSYANKGHLMSNIAIYEDIDDKKVVLPYRGKYTSNSVTTPGVYNAGPIDYIVKPHEEDIAQYIPSKIIDISNTSSMKEILEKKEVMDRLDEPWITSPDEITTFVISEDDKAEMRCLKTALNLKKVDFDKYSGRFGQNFPNDKRQLKNNSATLNIIKRYCDNMDMECLLTLRDKNPNVPNPIGREITVSLTDEYYGDDEEE